MCAGLPGGSMVKNMPGNAGEAGDAGSVPESGRSPGVGNGDPLQYSCLENPTDRRLAGYSSWGHKELNTAKQLSMHTGLHLCTHT